MDKCRTTTEPLTGELVVRNGPDKGVSRHLLVPVTLVGSSETCDLRIIDLTVRPVHCAVSVTPEGPHLRSIGGTTPVNDVPASTRLLKNGDIVKVGPVELEVHWTLPPAPQPQSAVQPIPPVQAPPVTEAAATFPEIPARKTAEWRTRLIAGRKDLLRERAELKEDFERQLVDLAHARDAADTARAHAEQELAHLQVLRRRFLRRWKKHWVTERVRHQTQVERLARERIHFERDRITHEGEKASFTAKRDQLVAWQDEYRQRVKTLEQDLTRREMEFSKREQAFAREEEAFREEKANFERRRAELTTELEGLDSRIRHTRTQLPESATTNPIVEQAVPRSPEENALQTSIQELADQRRVLTEQVTRMTDVVGDLRVQEQSLVNDLQNLAQELTRVEENIQRESAQAIASRAILQARQTFITQAEIEIRTRQQQLERQERAWERMLRMQTKQQERDLATIREQLMEANRLRESAAAAAARHAAASLDLADDRQRLDAALLALERAKKAFLEKDEKRKRVLARLERKLEAGRNKAHLELDRRAAAIETESSTLEILHSQVVARLEQLEQARREWLAIQAEQSKLAARTSVNAPRTPTEEAQAQQIEELRRELERLAEAVEPCLDGSLQIHRAA